jgi:hypothetical protein
MKRIYGRFTISGESIAAAIATDRELDRRMAGLSDRRKAKTWSRIQGRRWGRMIAAELRAMAADLQR